MSDLIFEHSTLIARPAAEVYAWHTRPGAFERLQPPWEMVELAGEHPGVVTGTEVRVRNRLGPWWIRWCVEHRDIIENRQFRDVMLAGPFARWEHLHRFEPVDAHSCFLVDRIVYRLPGGIAGRILDKAFVRHKLEQTFSYRHAVTKADLEMSSRPGKPMSVLISGSSGLVGRSLGCFLRSQGHQVQRLVRREPAVPDEIFWDPTRGILDARQLEGVQAVVHLAGENLAAGRWTAHRKKEILNSRVGTTRTLVQALRRMSLPPAVLIGASAVGIYGDRGAGQLTEKSNAGSGFLAEVCRAWEGELLNDDTTKMRTVALRAGIVLSPCGGALAKMLPAFRAGLGGRLGSGRQWISWIALDDLLSAILHLLGNVNCSGPLNAVAPNPVTNAEFAATLGRVLGRPACLPVPAFVLRGLFGEMADSALLASTRVDPLRLRETAYVFRWPHLEPALRHLLGRQPPPTRAPDYSVSAHGRDTL